ncbi:MAG: type III PLP-dependent enzyme [Dehalococcoidia bacterium]
MPKRETEARVQHKIRRLAGTRKTPFLVINKEAITRKYRLTRQALPEAHIFYAVKANAHKRIIKLLHAAGCGFEVSSRQELKLVLECGASPEEIISSNPLKSVDFIKAAHQAGVNHFAFDSSDEIFKLAEFAPRSNVYVRLSVPNEESEWPLDRKFGVESNPAIQLLTESARQSLIPLGITFHVGSQCSSEKAWKEAIKKCAQVWHGVNSSGLALKMVNVGGGFPIQHNKPVPAITELARAIKDSVKQEFPDGVEISAEPGRFLVGESGTLVTSVIAKARRNGENWLYLDAGVFNGLMESLGGIAYSMSTESEGPIQKWVVAGPSCDSMDVISNHIELPEPAIGDKVYISPAGAYTTVYASRFNGISIPRIYFV